MIIDDTEPEFVPWPDDMPGGGCWVRDPAWVGHRQTAIEDWRSWPPELRDPMMVRAPHPQGIPRVFAGPVVELRRWTSRQSGWSGLYFNGGSRMLVGVVGNQTFAHEWSHLIDFEWTYRLGLSESIEPLTTAAVWTDLWDDVQTANPGRGYTADLNVREFFAEVTAGWIKRRLVWIANACDPRVDGQDVRGPLTERALALLAEQLPYEGMDAVLDATLP